MVEEPAYDLYFKDKTHKLKVNNEEFLESRSNASDSSLLMLQYLEEDEGEREQEEYEGMRRDLAPGVDSVSKEKTDDEEDAEDVMDYPEDGGAVRTATGSIDLNDIDR